MFSGSGTKLGIFNFGLYTLSETRIFPDYNGAKIILKAYLDPEICAFKSGGGKGNDFEKTAAEVRGTKCKWRRIIGGGSYQNLLSNGY